MSDVTEPLQPQQELEVQGAVGESLVLPVANDDSPYVWTLELPDEVVEAGSTPDGRLRVRVDQAGSHVLTATLAEAGTPMTVLLIRVTTS